MSDSAKSFFRVAQSHIFVSIITAFVTISLAIGSYKEKINNMINENAKILVSLDKLGTSMNSLEKEVVALNQEMKDLREHRK